MSESELHIVRYLLGELSEAEQTLLEESYFADPAVFTKVTSVENTLVDKYARGLLSAEDHRRFEQHYLAHPERRERVKFAEALATKIDSLKPVVRNVTDQPTSKGLFASLRVPTLAWVVAIAVVIACAVVVWLYLQNQRVQQRDLAQSQQAPTPEIQKSPDVQNSPTPAVPSPKPSISPATHPSVSLALTVSGIRGTSVGPPAVLVIPAGTEEVRLQLKLKENDYAQYQVLLQPAGGAEVFRRVGLLPGGKAPGVSLIVPVPAARFASGDYVLTLKGVSKAGDIEDVSKLIFRVVRK